MPLVYRFQGNACGGHFHPEVCGILSAAAGLLDPTLPGQNDAIASRATGAVGCPVGVGARLRFWRQGRRTSCWLLFVHPCLHSVAPISRTIRCNRSTSRLACWWSSSTLALLVSRRRCSSVSSKPSRYRLAVLSFFASRIASALSRRILR